MASPHVIVLPFAQQGHINPCMQLSKKLASHGCLITFVLSENTVPKKPSSSPNITYQGVPDLLPPERSRGSNFRDSKDSMINMEAGFRDLLHRLHGLKQNPVSFIIADAFMLWSHDVAALFGIPCICFFTTNATTCCILFRLPTLIAQGVLPFARDEKGRISEELIDGIPGVPPIRPMEFPAGLIFEASHPAFRFTVESAAVFQKATTIVLNTYEELEGEAIEVLREEQIKAVYAVGPLMLLAGASPGRLDVKYWADEDHCLAWLDGRPESSVVYVSFGSVASLPVAQFRELALGLEESGQAFLWVVRPDSVPEGIAADALPEGFSDRTHDRGLTIAWAPQLQVLAHPAIGAFLTHGGWNSILENLSHGAAPMLCWPHMAEQRVNCKLVVDQWKMGLGFQHREPDGLVPKEEIARVVRTVMEGEEGRGMRAAAVRARDLAKQATSDEGGSSHRHFEALVQSLKARFRPSGRKRKRASQFPRVIILFALTTTRQNSAFCGDPGWIGRTSGGRPRKRAKR